MDLQPIQEKRFPCKKDRGSTNRARFLDGKRQGIYVVGDQGLSWGETP